MKLELEIDDGVHAELERIVQLHCEHGAPHPVESVEQLAGYILASIADGSRRPGAWERELLSMLGLVADADHDEYWPGYGT